MPIAVGTKGPKGKDAIGWNTRDRCVTTEVHARALRGSIGLAHAYSGTCALDIDDLEAARAWFKQHGLDLDRYLTAPERVGIRSGRPNRAKLIFRLPAPRPTRSVTVPDKSKPIVEFRCATRDMRTVQDVIPPSIHPNTGKPYEWDYDDLVTDWRTPPELPPELAALWLGLDRAAAPRVSSDPLDTMRSRTEHTEDEARVILASISADLPYEHWIRVGMALQHQFGDAGLELFDEWSLTAPHRYPTREAIESKWDTFNDERANPITFAFVLKLSNQADAALYDPHVDAAALAEPVVAATGATETAAAPPRPRFWPVPAAEFASRPAPPWIVRGVLPRAGLGVLFGESGSGKSFLVFDMVAAIARGAPWRGLRTTRCRVVYVVAEGAGGLRVRLRAYAQAHGVALGELEVAFVDDVPNLVDAAHCKAVADAVVGSGGAGVIVVDTLAQTTPGANENSGEDMGKVLAHCRALHVRTGALVLLVHHSGKDASKGARGWSGIRAAADVELEVTRDGDARCMRVTKLKDGADGAVFPFRLGPPIVVGLDDEGVEVTSCAVEHVDGPPPQRRRGEPTGANQRIVLGVLRELESEGELVTTEALLAAAARAIPETDAKKDDRRKLARRALDRLGKWIAFDGEFVRSVQ